LKQRRTSNKIRRRHY